MICDTDLKCDTLRLSSLDEVTSWGEWSGCDNTCTQRKERDCACTDETNREDLDRSKCADGTSYQMEKTCNKGNLFKNLISGVSM